MFIELPVFCTQGQLPAAPGVDGQAVQTLQHLCLGETVVFGGFADKLLNKSAEEGALVIAIQNGKTGLIPEARCM